MTRLGLHGVLGMTTLLGSACATGQDLGGSKDPVGDGGGDAPLLEVVGSTGTVQGTVLTPSELNPDPVYNALVFVPKGAVAPFAPGASCNRCGTVAEATAVVSALTGPDGKFTLEGVPAGTNIPLVIQVGRWRRQVTIPEVKAKTDTPLPAELTRLPRNQSEGDIPLIAVSTTYIDPFECVLKKMGISMSEFNNTTGRIHFYQTFGEMGSKGASLGQETRPATELWSSLPDLMKYDMVLLPCEAKPVLKTAQQTQNLIDYTNAGGRAFVTHYGYVWIQNGQAPFPSTARWHPDEPMGSFPAQVAGEIDVSFPKGEALRTWLDGFELAPSGKFQLYDSRYNVEEATAGVSQQWVQTTDPTQTVQAFTFNTPVGSEPKDQCGRVIYTNFHVALQTQDAISGALFPAECDQKPLTAQERVLEFMLLDLGSCVLSDHVPPTPPK